MAFLGGDENKVRIILTEFGQQTLAKKGLVKEIFYYNVYDCDINYLVDAFPNLMTNINGNNKTVTLDSITFKNEII